MTKSIHRWAHFYLAAFAGSVEVSGQAFKMAFKRNRRGHQNRLMTVKAAKTPHGRAAIVSAIAGIYASMDILGYQYSPIEPTLSNVFGRVSKKFIKHRGTGSSYPTCSRTL